MKSLLLGLILSIASQNLVAASDRDYLPEKGDYKFSLQDIQELFISTQQNYLTLNSSIVRNDARYKLLPIRNEFKIQDWYSYDWYSLQEMFKLDIDQFISQYDAIDFNEAKRLQYSKFPFNKKKMLHVKNLFAMKEWGGLTHPPLRNLPHPITKIDASFGTLDYSSLKSLYFSAEFQKELDQISHSELTFGNEVHAVADVNSFNLKKSLIKNAKKSILMSSLAFSCDDSTKELVDLLIGKKKEGLEVKVIADRTISQLMAYEGCLKYMSENGIEVLSFSDFFKFKGKAIYHTKSLVVDYVEAIAGGTNMIDADNTSRGTDFKNRDVDLYMKGPMVTDVVRQFFENWEYHLGKKKKSDKNLSSVKGELVAVYQKMEQERHDGRRGSTLYAQKLSSAETKMKGVCRFIKQAPYEDRGVITKSYLKLLKGVKQRLVITDPIKSDSYTAQPIKAPLIDKPDTFDYFNLLHKGVMELVREGMKIDYLTSNIDMAGNENVAILNDKIRLQLSQGKTLAANLSIAQIKLSNNFYGKPHYENLLKDWVPHKNVNVWNHISFLHSKIFYFDRIAASVGSFNFQHNATDHAYESTSICMDEKLNQELDEILVIDMANSIPLTFSKFISH